MPTHTWFVNPRFVGTRCYPPPYPLKQHTSSSKPITPPQNILTAQKHNKYSSKDSPHGSGSERDAAPTQHHRQGHTDPGCRAHSHTHSAGTPFLYSASTSEPLFHLPSKLSTPFPYLAPQHRKKENAPHTPEGNFATSGPERTLSRCRLLIYSDGAPRLDQSDARNSL